MNSSVNPLFSGLPLVMSDSSGQLPLSKLPPEILEQLPVGEKAVLQILQKEDGNFQGILKTPIQNFLIPINKNSFSLQGGTSVEIEVKIGETGKLIPLKENVSEAQAKITAPKSVEKFLREIETTPIKTADFVKQTLQKNGLPPQTAQKISDGIKSIQAQIESFGGQNITDNQSVLKPIMQTLKQMAAMPEKTAELQEQLKQDVENLIGQKITGEVASRSNDITTIQTPLGKTLFESKIKLPLSEKVVLDMAKTVSEENMVKVWDNILETLVPHKKNAVTFQSETIKEQFKFLTELEKHLSKEIFKAVLNKLPVQTTNLFQNMVRFYQSAQQKSIERWLGDEIAGRKTTDIISEKSVADGLKNFLASSVKETPVWKIVEMPLFDGNWIAPLKVAVKKQNEKNKKNASGKGSEVRFIMETEFSKLGRFQFDGFANKTKRSLDLIIRTSEQADDDFCSNVINLFKKSLYALDYTGTIKINRQEAFINFQEASVGEGIYV